MGKNNKQKHSVQSPVFKRGVSGAIIPSPPGSQQTADASAQSQAMVSPEKGDDHSIHSIKSQHSKQSHPGDETKPKWSPNYDTILAFVLDLHTTLKPGMPPYDAVLNSEITAHDFIHLTLGDMEDLLKDQPGHTRSQA